MTFWGAMLTFKFEHILIWAVDRKIIGLTVKIGQVRETDRAYGDNLGSITTSNGPPIKIFPNPQNRLSLVWQS